MNVNEMEISQYSEFVEALLTGSESIDLTGLPFAYEQEQDILVFGYEHGEDLVCDFTPEHLIDSLVTAFHALSFGNHVQIRMVDPSIEMVVLIDRLYAFGVQSFKVQDGWHPFGNLEIQTLEQNGRVVFDQLTELQFMSEELQNEAWKFMSNLIDNEQGIRAMTAIFEVEKRCDIGGCNYLGIVNSSQGNFGLVEWQTPQTYALDMGGVLGFSRLQEAAHAVLGEDFIKQSVGFDEDFSEREEETAAFQRALREFLPVFSSTVFDMSLPIFERIFK